MFDIPSIDEDLAIDGLELVGAWSEHLRDNVRSLPWWRELVAVLVALDKVEHQVPDVEGSTLHPIAMVLGQHLLVLGRVEEGNIACFI